VRPGGRLTPDPGAYTAAYVEDRLEWAGCFPAGMTVFWPDISGREPRRYAVPTMAAITAMDEAYRWVGLITDPDPDRLVMIRSLVLRPCRNLRAKSAVLGIRLFQCVVTHAVR